ncbi:MAG TPA: TolC family protein, partial [Planctomycetaceae bacterium]
GLDSFYNTLLDNDQTGWDLGLELTTPVGLRSAKSQVRFFELRLAKARAALATMEHEISHELAAAFQEVDRFYAVAQTSLNRRAASEERLRAYEAQLELGGIGGGGAEGGGPPVNIDQLLRSQVSLAQSEVAFYQALVAYNQAIADVHLRQGTLLERAGVTLAEGNWTPQAYRQAVREAWARSHAFRNPLLDAEPDPFARDGEAFPTAVPDPSGLAPVPIPEQAYPTVPPPAPLPADEFVPPAPEAPPVEPEPTPAEPIVDSTPVGGVSPAGGLLPAGPASETPGMPGHVRIIRGMNR